MKEFFFNFLKLNFEQQKLEKSKAPGITLDIDNTYVREGAMLTLTQIIDDVTGVRYFALKEWTNKYGT